MLTLCAKDDCMCLFRGLSIAYKRLPRDYLERYLVTYISYGMLKCYFENYIQPT